MSAPLKHVGRVPSHGERANAKNAASGDAAYNAACPADVGRVPPRGASPEGAKEGGKVALCEITETRVEQTGPSGKEFTYVDIGSIELDTKRIVEPKVLPASKAPSRAKQVLKRGDVLVSMTRPNRNAVALVPPELDGAIGSTGFHVLRAKDAEPGFLFYAVQTNDFIDALCEKVQGALYPAVRPRDVSSFKTFLPSSVQEQRRIVAEIEKQFTRLEAGVAALRRVQANLKRYRAAILKAACEGRLVPTEAELHRQLKTKNSKLETGAQLLARILTERRQNWQGRGQYKEPAAPDTSKLPAVPDGWTWATVEQLASPEPNSITDGPFGSNLKTEHYMNSGPRVLRLQNIGDGVYVDAEAHITQTHFERLQKHRIFAGDVVIAGFGENPPRCCIIPESLGPAIVKADCIRFKPHSSVLPKYMNTALNSDPVRKRTKGMVHGVGRPRLNLGEIKSIALPLPPLAEQTRIVAEVERRFSVVEELESVVTAIFYAQGVKANVLFFDRKPAQEKPWTQKLWIYDLRTNLHFTLKENTLKCADLDDFVACYNPKNRHSRKESERFKSFTYDELAKRDKVNLDIFWLKDDALEESANLPAPEIIAADITADLEAAMEQFATIAEDLKK